MVDHRLPSWDSPGQYHKDVIYIGDALGKRSVLVTLGHLLWEAREDVHGAAHSTDLSLVVSPGFTSLSATLWHVAAMRKDKNRAAAIPKLRFHSCTLNSCNI